MKFSSILGFATLALAAVPTVQERDAAKSPTVIGSIVSIAGDLQAAVEVNAGAIAKAVGQISQSVSATIIVQLEAVVSANLAKIVSAISAAANTIVGVTISTTGEIIVDLSKLGQAEIDNLVDAIEIVVQLMVRLEASLQLTITNLKPATETLLASEIAAVKAVLTPFLLPLQAYAKAVLAASAQLNVSVTALAQASAELDAEIKSILVTLGLPAITAA